MLFRSERERRDGEQDREGEAIKSINDAINSVSSQRGKLGATQNRLEHTINNLNVNVENMTAAESRIRDVDMAKEMMSYTKTTHSCTTLNTHTCANHPHLH